MDIIFFIIGVALYGVIVVTTAIIVYRVSEYDGYSYDGDSVSFAITAGLFFPITIILYCIYCIWNVFYLTYIDSVANEYKKSVCEVCNNKTKVKLVQPKELNNIHAVCKKCEQKNDYLVTLYKKEIEKTELEEENKIRLKIYKQELKKAKEYLNN